MRKLSILLVVCVLMMSGIGDARALLRGDRYFVTGQVSEYDAEAKQISVWNKEKTQTTTYMLNRSYPGITPGMPVFLIIDKETDIVQLLKPVKQ